MLLYDVYTVRRAHIPYALLVTVKWRISLSRSARRETRYLRVESSVLETWRGMMLCRVNEKCKYPSFILCYKNINIECWERRPRGVLVLRSGVLGVDVEVRLRDWENWREVLCLNYSPYKRKNNLATHQTWDLCFKLKVICLYEINQWLEHRY